MNVKGKMRCGRTSRTEHSFPIVIAILLLTVMIPGLLYMMQRDDTEPTRIFLQQGNIRITGKGATEKDNKVTIDQGGHYLIEGTLENGQIYVDADDDEIVLLELGGVDICNPSGTVIYVENAEQTTILPKAGTENKICSGAGPGGQADGTDGGADEEGETQEDGAAIYAEDELFIAGEGSLEVTGGLNNGIQSKAGLQIGGGNITVSAVNNGVKGKDRVTINGGNLRIEAGKKGVQAKYEMNITGGDLKIVAKEGLEANQILIEGGTMDIAAKDDGINANGGEAKQKKDPSGNVVETMPNLTIRGGMLHIDAEGDGLDSNGNLFIEGGELVIDGPTKDDDGPIDFGTENGGICTIADGTVLAIGSSGMAETFDESSRQCSFRYLFDAPYEEGSEIVIADAAGKELYRHTAGKKGASVVFSSPELVLGETYTLRVGEWTVEIIQNTVSVR